MIVTTTLIVLLVVCLIVLVIQLMIVRQIGVLHGRLGPRVSVPTETSVRILRMLDESDYAITAHDATAVVLVSAACYVCRPVLESIGPLAEKEDIRIGLLAERNDVVPITEQFGLPLEKTFDGSDLATSLAIAETPILCIIDQSGQVRKREFVDSIETIQRSLRGHDQGKLSRKEPQNGKA